MGLLYVFQWEGLVDIRSDFARGAAAGNLAKDVLLKATYNHSSGALRSGPLHVTKDGFPFTYPAIKFA